MTSSMILVVEDEQLVALDIAQSLARLGYGVTTAASGEEALSKFEQACPDLVLMDIKLGSGIDGIEVARRIRQAVSDVPVVYLTAYADEATLEHARMSEPDGYVLKPFNIRELKATIEMALQRYSTRLFRRRQEAVQRFLADASLLLSQSLDYQTVVSRAADLLVPRHADWCCICLQQTPDLIPSLTMVRPATASQDSEPPAERGSILEAVLAGAPSRVEVITDPATLPALLGAEHLSSLRRLELTPQSIICVPLLIRAQPLGAILLVSGRGDPEQGTSKFAVAEDFARRLGTAIDNALLYRQAQRASRLREEVLAVVSHDLRAPLQTILLGAQSLARIPAARRTADTTIRAAQRMNRLITDLVDAAAIDAGRWRLERRTHRADEVVLEAVSLQRPSAEAKSISLHQVSAGQWLQVLCDRERVLQVLSNLLANAIKFTPAGGSIEVRVERSGSFARFAISDDGPGIPPEHLSHLFERFWRPRGPHEGAGLGLYIARGIIDALGGDIWVESQLGRGSTFYFTLPIGAPAETAAPGP